MHRYLLVILFALASCSGRERSVECNGVDEPSSAQKASVAHGNLAPGGVSADDPLMSEIASIVGPGATSCGRIPLGQDPMKAWQCAEDADRRGAAHWFAIQREGIDSDIWLASTHGIGPEVHSFLRFELHGWPRASAELHQVRL